MSTTSIIQAFLRTCTKELNDKVSLSSPLSIAEIRQSILKQQQSCLERVVQEHSARESPHDEEDCGGVGDALSSQALLVKGMGQSPSASSAAFSVEQVQADLRHHAHEIPILRDDLERMNDAARCCFCRLVLYSEFLWQRAEEEQEGGRDTQPARFQRRQLVKSGRINRDDLLEFCGLCTIAVKLKCVQQYLVTGAPMFAAEEGKYSPGKIQPRRNTAIPQQRLEQVQHHFLRALGYCPDHATQEIERILVGGRGDGPEDYRNDSQIVETFHQLLDTMNAALTTANYQAHQSLFSDHEEGGCTRVISVAYSEIVEGGVSTAPCGSERMEDHTEIHQRAALEMARQTSTLEQEILGELLALRDEEREMKLHQARLVVETILQRLTDIPVGPERVAFLRSMDPKTQRQMAMHKIWENLVASNGGKEPVIHYQRNFHLN